MSRLKRKTKRKLNTDVVDVDADKDLPIRVVGLIIASACIIVYYQTLSIGFLSDDWVIISKIKHGTIADIGAEGLFFRPLAVISFAIDFHIFGLWATGFHIVNLLMHIATSLGVAACAALIVRKPYAGLIAGLVFAIHPAHPEAVTWIAGRYDVLCGALLAWALFFYLKLSTTDANKPKVLYAIALILFILACFAKEMAFGFPLVIILCELLPIGNSGHPARGFKAGMMRVAPFIIAAAVIFALRWLRLHGIGAAGIQTYGDAENNIPGVLYQIILQPLAVLFLPLNRFILQPTTSPAVIAVEAGLLLPLVMLTCKRNWRIVAFCIAAVIISFLPTARFGIEESRLMSARFLYTPSIFFAILIAALFVDCERPGWRRSMALIAGGIYFAVMPMVIYQNNYPWQNAGAIARTAAASSDKLIDEYADEWGNVHKSLVIANIPRASMGAYLFQWGLPEMLRMRHEGKLDNIHIDVIFEDAPQEGTFNKIEASWKDGGVVWLFDFKTSSFVEYKPNPF